MSNQTGLTIEQVEQFINVIDQALQSDNPAVMQALQNLILLTTLTAGASNSRIGPIGQLIEDMRVLQARISRLEDEIRFNQYQKQQKQWTGYPSGTWPYTVTSTTSGKTTSGSASQGINTTSDINAWIEEIYREAVKGAKR